MSNKQQGAALVIVMALLTGAMVVGVAGMQSTLVDERLAGNYRASVLAQMAAEDVAGYIQKNYVSLPVSNDIGKNIEDWNVIATGVFPKVEDVSVRRSYFECLSVNSAPCKSTNKSYEEDIGNNLPLPFYIARGQVLEDVGEDVVAEHRIVVAKTKDFLGGGPDDDIFSDLDKFEGESVVAGEEEESCGKNRDNIEGCRILGEDNVPRPDRAIDDFISRYNSDDIPEEKVVKSCDDEFNKTKLAEYVLCMEEDFEGKIDSEFDGLTIIVSGERDEDDGEVEYEDGNVDDVNVKGDIELNIIASGDIDFKGFGNKTLTGNFWSGGGVEFNGRTNIVGAIVAVEDVEFNGKANVSGGLKINDESDGSEGGKGGGDIIWFSY